MAIATKNGAALVIEKIVLPVIDEREVLITVEQITPLIQHRFSEKAKKAIYNKNAKKAAAPKEAKDKQKEFEASLHVVEGREKWPLEKQGRYYHPAEAFKAAIVGGLRFADDSIPMTRAKGLVFIPDDPILTFEELVMREDIVRFGQSSTDIRYRGEFRGWGCAIKMQFNASILSLEQLVNMVNLGGFSQGIGEWRPSAPKALNGEYGRFRVVGAEEIS